MPSASVQDHALRPDIRLTLNEYQVALAAIPYGKRLPTALYLHREGLAAAAPELDRLASHLADG
ncbi:MAG: hypothetical protein M5U12_32765 [Verrucomicrobia bacterium]|nr:hypothetical protein [Verrucomicrobiota bacterium]